MSSFPDSFDQPGPEAQPAGPTHPFDDDDDYVDAGDYSNFSDKQSVDDSTIFNHDHDAVFESDGNPADNGDFVQSDGPILPPPAEMQEEGFALREWRRQNAILLEQKEKTEKEILSQIIEDANEYKVAFHEKRKVTCENNKTNNREKEKLFLANHEKFHKDADKNYWKAIAELIPNEVPAIEKKRGKKEQEKKPSIAVIQGPKPGKPTDLARMRQVLVKLKHNSPTHLKLAPPPAKDSKTDDSPTTPSKTAAVEATPEAVVAA